MFLAPMTFTHHHPPHDIGVENKHKLKFVLEFNSMLATIVFDMTSQ